MCDYGRDSYHREIEDRIGAPMLRDGASLREVTWDEALDFTAARLKAAPVDQIAIVGSPRQSNETAWLTRRFARDIVKTPLLDARVDGSHANTTKLADYLLRRQDPHPNNNGVAALGLHGATDVEGILNACQAGRIQVLYLMGTEIFGRHDAARVRDALAKVPCVVVHAHHNVPEIEQQAHVIFADAGHLEQQGTYVNAMGRVQRFQMAYPPIGTGRTACAVLANLAARLGGQLPEGAGSALFDLMAKAEPAFAGLTWDGLGKHGQPLKGAEPAAVGS
jgi:predicted molibdopterin-dependent oxidoreductase YjgC